MKPLMDWEVQLHFKQGGALQPLIDLYQAYSVFKSTGQDMTVNQLRGDRWGTHPNGAIGSGSILAADPPSKPSDSTIPAPVLSAKKAELAQLKQREIDPLTDADLAADYPDLFP